MKQILQNQSDINVTGREGRRGENNWMKPMKYANLKYISASFEVKVNDTLIHSKLSTMAFPDFEDVSKIAAEVAAGHDVRTKCKQQPITNCIVM